MDLKSIMEELKSITNEIKTLNDKIDGQSDNVINWMQFLENKTTSRLIKIDETMCKSANSINVIVRLLAGAQNISSNVLRQILNEAEALTDKVKSTSDIDFKDNSKELANTDFLESRIKDLIIKASILFGKNLSTGNPSFDPFYANISSTRSTLSQTSSVQNTLNQNQSSTSTLSNISNASVFTNVSSSSVTDSKIRKTLLIQNAMNQNQISSTISSNMFNLSSNTANYPMPYVVSGRREKEKLEQAALRKKYRNKKFNSLDKFKNNN